MYKFHNKDVIHFKEITLLIKDKNRSKFFYTKILGLNVLEENEGYIVLSQNNTNPLITLVEDKNALPLANTLGIYHFALLLSSKQELALILDNIIDNKYPLTGASDHGVSYALYLDDPDGIGIELYVDKDEALWPKGNSLINMYTDYLDLDELMSHKGSIKFKKIDDLTILGHLHFHVSDIVEAKKFYSDILGLNEVFKMSNHALFLSDFNYHHHLGINTWIKNGEIQKENQVGLKSYTLNIPKDKYPIILENLSLNRVPVLYDGTKSYVIDLLNQKIKFYVE